jgi:hypothetical protein
VEGSVCTSTGDSEDYKFMQRSETVDRLHFNLKEAIIQERGTNSSIIRDANGSN